MSQRYIVIPTPIEHYGWLQQRVMAPFTSDWRAIHAVDTQTGLIRGMVAYYAWMGNSVWAHMAADCPGAIRALIGPELDAPAFKFPFIDERKEWLFGCLRESNQSAIRIDLKLGFKEFARVPNGAAYGEDLILVRMHRDECRWITGRRRSRQGMTDLDVMHEPDLPLHQFSEAA